MFGYVNVNRNELSEENKKIYQGFYCGLCQTLKDECGKKGQLLLNYDMTFLVALLTGLYEPESTDELFTCAIHPTKKRNMIRNEISQYGAHMNVLLAYYNLVDDWTDDHNYTKKAFASMIRKDYERISKLYPRQSEAISNYIEGLAQLEESKERNIDIVAGLTGDMLGELFAWKEDEWYHELKTLGFYLGKFIYLMDAYEDLEDDQKNNSYNPLKFIMEETQTKDEYETLVRLMMTSMISEAAKSFERLPILLHADIIRNILYSGVWTKYEYIQLKRNKTK